MSSAAACTIFRLSQTCRWNVSERRGHTSPSLLLPSRGLCLGSLGWRLCCTGVPSTHSCLPFASDSSGGIVGKGPGLFFSFLLMWESRGWGEALLQISLEELVGSDAGSTSPFLLALSLLHKSDFGQSLCLARKTTFLMLRVSFVHT